MSGNQDETIAWRVDSDCAIYWLQTF